MSNSVGVLRSFANAGDALGTFVEALVLAEEGNPVLIMMNSLVNQSIYTRQNMTNVNMNGDFTIEIWQETTDSIAYPFSTQDTSGTGGVQYVEQSVNTGNVEASYVNGDTGAWSHGTIKVRNTVSGIRSYAVSFDFATGTFRTFFEGVQIGTQVSAASANKPTALNIMGLTPTSGGQVGFAMARLVITNACKYTGNYTPKAYTDYSGDSFDSDICVDFRLDNPSFVDEQSRTWNAPAQAEIRGYTDGGARDASGGRIWRTTDRDKGTTVKIGGVPYFESDGFKQINSLRTSSLEYLPPTGVLTVENIIRISDIGNPLKFQLYDDLLPNTNYLSMFEVRNDAGTFRVAIGAEPLEISGVTVAPNTDILFSAVVDGVNNKIDLWIDGVWKATTTSVNLSLLTAVKYACFVFLPCYQDGYLTDSTTKFYSKGARITRGRRYAGTDAFPTLTQFPTAGVTDKTPSAGKTHLLNFNGANNGTVFTDSVAGNTWYRTGGAVTSTTHSKFGTASLRLNAVGDTLYNRARSNEFGLEDFTEEFWVRLLSGSGSRRIFQFGTNTEYSWNLLGGMSIESSGTTLQLKLGVGNFNLANYLLEASVAGLSTSLYKHVALTRENGVLRAFFEGTKFGGDIPYNFPIISRHRQFGDGATGALCHIDGYRQTFGQALYTSNFSPPTSEFT